MPTIIDMMGRKYGRLTVTGLAGRAADRRATWHADCDCGESVTVTGSGLRSGRTRSCGCLHRDQLSARLRIDLAGQRFGRLTVVSFAGVRRDKVQWNCRCDCGVEKAIVAAALRNGTVVSCGCFHAERLRANRKPVVDYVAAHDRVRARRGSASTHNCVDCGRQAKDWSYDGLDPDALIQNVCDSALSYSLKIDHYQPRCKPCHSRYDAAMRAGRVA